MKIIHFFDICSDEAPADRKSRYGAETSCETCIRKMLDRGLLRECDAATMRYLAEADARAEWDADQDAIWASTADGERAMAEMGLLR